MLFLARRVSTPNQPHPRFAAKLHIRVQKLRALHILCNPVSCKHCQPNCQLPRILPAALYNIRLTRGMGRTSCLMSLGVRVVQEDVERTPLRPCNCQSIGMKWAATEKTHFLKSLIRKRSIFLVVYIQNYLFVLIQMFPCATGNMLIFPCLFTKTSHVNALLNSEPSAPVFLASHPKPALLHHVIFRGFPISPESS